MALNEFFNNDFRMETVYDFNPNRGNIEQHIKVEGNVVIETTFCKLLSIFGEALKLDLLPKLHGLDFCVMFN